MVLFGKNILVIIRSFGLHVAVGLGDRLFELCQASSELVDRLDEIANVRPLVGKQAVQFTGVLVHVVHATLSWHSL